MKVIGITTTYPRGQLGAADAVIDSLTAIGIRISGARLEVTVTPN
jgi:hypothetical protein